MKCENRLLTLAFLCLAATASHASSVDITVAGQMNITRGNDVNNLDGASFSAEYRYGTTPFSFDPANAQSFAAPMFAEITFTNRPAGAADVTISYGSPDRPLLRADNGVAPSPGNDLVTVLSASLASTSEFPNDLRAPAFTFDLGTQDFFPGDQPPPNFVFSTADVSTFSASEFRLSSPTGDYEVTDAIFTVEILEDTDNDGVFDPDDNCILVPNGPDLPDAGGLIQYDSNDDGFGNACDPDLNNDGVVDFADLPPIQDAFFSIDVDPNWNPDADLNGDGVIDFADLPPVQTLFFGSPGPSGLVLP